MKAICKEKAVAGASLVDAPMPKVGPTDVLVRVKAASICGTDLHIYSWDHWAASRIQPPLIFGHEFTGEVVEVGSRVQHVKVGDHVSSETHIPCGNCSQCHNDRMHLCQNLKLVGVDRDGGFAEYVSLPKICCVKNDRSLPWEIASILEPFGNAVYAVSESDVTGKSVAIFGDGPIGIFATAVAKAYGAGKLIVCGMQPFRLNVMRQYGPDHVINVRETNPRDVILDLTGGAGVDVVLEMSGSAKAIHDGFSVLRGGGTFVAFGVPGKPLEVNFADEIIFKGIVLKAIFGRRMFETWREVERLLSSRRIDLRPIITHEFPFEKFNDAMQLLNAANVQAGKVILKP